MRHRYGRRVIRSLGERKLLGTIAFCLLATAVVSGVHASPSAAAVSSTMNGFVAQGDLEFGLAFADGTEVGGGDMPGPVIPAGTYQVSVDDTSPEGNFDLTGNGVS